MRRGRLYNRGGARMRVAPAVTLDKSQRHTLQQWVKSRSLPARQVERSRIVLLAAEGKTDLEIAASLNITNQKSGALAEAVSAVRSGGLGEGCAPSGSQACH